MSDIIGLDVFIPYPPDSSAPMIIVDQKASLKSAFVDRDSFSFLYSSEWDQDGHGFYALFSHIDEKGHFTVYIGQTDSSFAQRLRDHDKKKDYWRTAVLFKHTNEMARFDRMETLYLEGLLVDVFLTYPSSNVMNDKKTGEKHFAEKHKLRMDEVIAGALRILQLRGYYRSKSSSITHNIKPQQNNNILKKPVRPILPELATIQTSHNSEINVETLSDLRQIMREIKQADPTQSTTYSRWSSDKILKRIIATNPSNSKELNDITKVGANIMSRSDDVLAILKKHSTVEEKPAKRG